MAKGYNNTVPQGLAGTGNAVIYGDNPVAAQYGNQLEAFRAREYQDELLRQKKAEDLARTFRDNQLAASEGRLWAQDIGALEQNHIQKGIELKQRGIDPYGVSADALDYQKERRYVQGQQGYRKATEQQFDALNKLIAANPDKYRSEDIQAMHDFFANTKLNDAYSKNMALPQLRERFNPAEALTGFKGITQETKDQRGNLISELRTPDDASTDKGILGRLSQAPGGAEHIAEITSGIPLQELTTFSSSYADNRKRAEAEIKGNPTELFKLATQGVLPGTPQMNAVIDDIAASQTRAKRKFDSTMEGYRAAAYSGENFFDKNTPIKPDLADETLAERIRHNKAMEAKAVTSGAKTDTTSADVRRDWIQGIRKGEPSAMEKLLAAGNASTGYAKDDNFKMIPVYENGKKITVGAGKGKFKLHVPAKVKLEGDDETVITPAKDYVINLGDPNFETFVNTLIGDITGARVDLGSLGAKGSNLKKSPPSTKVKTPVKTSTTKPAVAANPASPKKGQTMQVQGGTAIFDGTKWVMKQ